MMGSHPAMPLLTKQNQTHTDWQRDQENIYEGEVDGEEGSTSSGGG